MEQIFVAANGLRFACLSEGAGPLVLLLHGFPDNSSTWEHQFAPLVAAGYRVVAPNLRGYPPTDIPPNGFYDGATLAEDVRGLIEALSHASPPSSSGMIGARRSATAFLHSIPNWSAARY